MDQEAAQSPKPKWSGSGFYCEVCACSMTSKIVMDSHLQGTRHKSAVKRLEEEQRLSQKLNSKTGKYHYPGIEEQDDGYYCQKIYTDDYTSQVTRKPTRLEKLLKPDDIAIGLDFVSEYYNKNSPDLERFYSCSLCSFKCKGSEIMRHVLGTSHRMKMMKDHSPSDYEKTKLQNLPENSLTYLIEDWAFNFKKKYGSGLPSLKPIPPPVKKMVMTGTIELGDSESDDDDDVKHKATKAAIKKEVGSSGKAQKSPSPQPSTSRGPARPASPSNKDMDNKCNEVMEDDDDDIVILGECKRQPKILSTIDLVNDVTEESPIYPHSEDIPPPLPIKSTKDSPDSPPPSETISAATSPPPPTIGLDPDSCWDTINSFKSRNSEDSDFLLLLINTLQAHCLNFELKDVPTKFREMLVSNQIKSFNNYWSDIINKFVVPKKQEETMNDDVISMEEGVGPPDLPSTAQPPLSLSPLPQPPSLMSHRLSTTFNSTSMPPPVVANSTVTDFPSSSAPEFPLATPNNMTPFHPPATHSSFTSSQTGPPLNMMTFYPTNNPNSLIPQSLAPSTMAPPPNMMTFCPSAPLNSGSLGPPNMPPSNGIPFPPPLCPSNAPRGMPPVENPMPIPTTVSSSSQYWNPPFPFFPPWSQQLSHAGGPPSF